MPELDSFGNRSPQHPLHENNTPDLHSSLADSEKPDFSTQDHDLVLPQRLPQHTKDLPLTDIGTSPPAFEINSLTHKGSRDSYESSELSDLGDDGSEAETDKMDFLDDDNSSLRDKVSDLHALSELTEMARLQGVDSDDLDDNFPKDISHEDALQLNGKHDGDHEELERPAKQRRLLGSKDHDDASEDDSESGTRSPASASPTTAATEAVELETSELIRHESSEKAADVKKEPVDEDQNEDVLAEEGDNEDAEEADHEDAENGDVDETEAKKEEEDDELDNAKVEENGALEEPAEDAEEAEADVEDTEKQEEEEQAAEAAEKAEAEKIDEASAKEQQIAEENDVNMDEHRKLAVDELISIETDFAHLRDKLYQDKLSLLEHELQLCLDGLHPELLQIYLKVNEFYQDSIRLANATLNYSLKCINNETIASRTAIHQDFMKNSMDMKNDMITEATLQWYKVNKERSSLDQLVPDFNFAAIPTIPTSDEPRGFSGPIVAGGSSMEYYMENPGLSKKAMKQNILYELVQQRNSLNEELGILNGLKEFHGFPCGVSSRIHKDEPGPIGVEELILRKATNDEVEEDLRAMGIPIN